MKHPEIVWVVDRGEPFRPLLCWKKEWNSSYGPCIPYIPKSEADARIAELERALQWCKADYIRRDISYPSIIEEALGGPNAEAGE